MEEISKKVHEELCAALDSYDKGERDIEQLQEILQLIFQEWEYIQKKL